jgi:hypothetical protein
VVDSLLCGIRSPTENMFLSKQTKRRRRKKLKISLKKGNIFAIFFSKIAK